MYQRIFGREKISQFSNHGIRSCLIFILRVGLCLPGVVAKSQVWQNFKRSWLFSVRNKAILGLFFSVWHSIRDTSSADTAIHSLKNSLCQLELDFAHPNIYQGNFSSLLDNQGLQHMWHKALKTFLYARQINSLKTVIRDIVQPNNRRGFKRDTNRFAETSYICNRQCFLGTFKRLLSCFNKKKPFTVFRV